MNRVRDYYGAVYAGGTLTLMARVEDAEGDPLMPGAISEVRYSIEERPACGEATPVTGHDNVALVANSVLYEGLQTGAPWDADEEGYNFRHEIDVTAQPAFPTAGRPYAVTYRLTLATGQPVIFRFLIEAI